MHSVSLQYILIVTVHSYRGQFILIVDYVDDGDGRIFWKCYYDQA